ncbi:MAG: DUF1579 domain-containing protein [Gemmataceae bacterium]|nr:DUF1579 domain-containing protein [Gemmataceae bacterium]MCI0740226.1 DUF1579 domain-containing protein [Gemmataceae bacterium]
MVRHLCGGIVLGVVLALVTSSSAGEKKDPFEMLQPGPEHKIMEKMAGTFAAHSKAWFDPTKKEGEESTGVMNRKLILGGRFLQEAFQGKVMGMPFEGGGLLGYDRMKKTYVSIWVDSMGTGIMQSTGSYDSAKKAFTFQSEDIDPFSGQKTKSRTIIRLVSDDEEVMEMYSQPSDASAKERKVLEVNYKRKK